MNSDCRVDILYTERQKCLHVLWKNAGKIVSDENVFSLAYCIYLVYIDKRKEKK